jgi:mycofactocin precursor
MASCTAPFQLTLFLPFMCFEGQVKLCSPREVPENTFAGETTRSCSADTAPFVLRFSKEVIMEMENKEKREQEEQSIQNDKQEDDIFSTHEIVIEELAIDGICGVY